METVAKKIEASPLYICGGTPRDKYLGHLENISDLDITTGDKTVDYLSQEFAIFLNKNYNVTRKTMDDGHSSIFIGNLKIDFSSNFNVPSIDTILKNMDISNPTSMQKEMYSRDFTCNALLLSFNLKELTDPTNNGIKDIKDKMIRTCLAPEITLKSNRNRVVRAIYLAVKLDFDIDKSVIDYVSKYPEIVKISTTKSLNEKLNYSFTKDPDKTSYFITKMNLWQHIPISQIMQPYYMKNVKGKFNV